MTFPVDLPPGTVADPPPGVEADPLGGVDGSQVTGQPPFDVDPRALLVLERLWEHGHAAFLVGGAVRDALLGRPTHDWDVATDALPERILAIFPEGSYENRFGTVLAHRVEITTFRRDHQYADHRRPDRVTFTDEVDDDLARRDFTVNAIAWGRRSGAARAAIEDPTSGVDDLRARTLRAVGDPDARFEEDALRLLRAARIAAAVGLTIEPRTRAQMVAHASDARWISAERVGIELRRMVEADVPSVAFRILEQTGVLPVVLPELARQRGVPQAKIAGQDLLDHTLATLDAAARLYPGDERLLLAALLHDIGKPSTMRDGHFYGHAEQGARLARQLLERLRFPRRESSVVGRLVEGHMFAYQPAWTDAAVRRFMRRTGPDIVDEVLRLRQADNLGSGTPADDGHLEQLRERVTEQRTRGVPLSLAYLAVDGHDLQAELGLPQGPGIGELLDRLLDSVISDPGRNTREQLIADARSWLAADQHREAEGGDRKPGEGAPDTVIL